MITWYDGDMLEQPACGGATPVDADMIAAVPESWGKSWCGKKITLKKGSKTVTVLVVDFCATCELPFLHPSPHSRLFSKEHVCTRKKGRYARRGNLIASLLALSGGDGSHFDLSKGAFQILDTLDVGEIKDATWSSSGSADTKSASVQQKKKAKTYRHDSSNTKKMHHRRRRLDDNLHFHS